MFRPTRIPAYIMGGQVRVILYGRRAGASGSLHEEFHISHHLHNDLDEPVCATRLIISPWATTA